MSQVKIQGNASGTGIFTVAAPNSNTDRTLTLPDSTGTVVVSGTTPSLNGIQFPATQSASADANTLDDYEEGTFTVTAYGASTAGTTTYTNQNGVYTKIGRMVTITVQVDVSTMTGSGTLTFGGLPFTSITGGTNPEYVGSIMYSSLDYSTGYTQLTPYIGANSTTFIIWQSGDNQGWTVVPVDSTFGVRATITYFTS